MVYLQLSDMGKSVQPLFECAIFFLNEFYTMQSTDISRIDHGSDEHVRASAQNSSVNLTLSLL